MFEKFVSFHDNRTERTVRCYQTRELRLRYERYNLINSSFCSFNEKERERENEREREREKERALFLIEQ